MQSVPITTNVVNSNPTHGEVYSIQHYLKKFVSWLATDRWFSPGILASSTNKPDRHDIAEIFLKVALNFITLTSISNFESSSLATRKRMNTAHFPQNHVPSLCPPCVLSVPSLCPPCVLPVPSLCPPCVYITQLLIKH